MSSDLDPLLKRLSLANTRRTWRDLVRRAEADEWAYETLLLTLFDPTVAASQGIRVNLLNFVLMTCLVLTMIASLQAVGVIMLLGLLIAPAATVYLLCDSYPAMLWGGGLIGMFGSCVGLLLSYRLELPSGA